VLTLLGCWDALRYEALEALLVLINSSFILVATYQLPTPLALH
jgi:hypothetical protein